MTSNETKKMLHSHTVVHDSEMEQNLKKIRATFGVMKGKSKYKTLEESDKALREVRQESFRKLSKKFNLD